MAVSGGGDKVVGWEDMSGSQWWGRQGSWVGGHEWQSVVGAMYLVEEAVTGVDCRR